MCTGFVSPIQISLLFNRLYVWLLFYNVSAQHSFGFLDTDRV